MKRTVKVKINMSKNKYSYLSVCNQIYNEYVNWAYENKTWSKAKAHQELYKAFRNKYPTIPSALIQSIRDSALEAVKALKFHPKKKAPQKKSFSAVRFDKRTLSFKNNLVSISTDEKRYRQKISHPRITQLLENGWVFSAGTLQFDPKNRCFVLGLIFSKNAPEKVSGQVLGIDRGIYNLVATSEGYLFSSRYLRGIKRKRSYNRKQLQTKGTPSAKRKLKKLSGKEKRFSRDINHCISKYLANLPNISIFVLEDLKGIRKKRRGKLLNTWLSNWPFFEFQTFLTYKAEELGKEVIYTDARYTSQRCHLCWHKDSRNRIKGRYICNHCGLVEHSDINAAKVIRNQWINSILEDRAGCRQSTDSSAYLATTSPHPRGGGN